MFIRFDMIHERDGRTDRQTLHDSVDRACIASLGKNSVLSLLNSSQCDNIQSEKSIMQLLTWDIAAGSQTVSRLLTLTDWLTDSLKFVRRRLESTAEYCSVECCCIMATFTVIIFAPTSFFLRYTCVVHIFKYSQTSLARPPPR